MEVRQPFLREQVERDRDARRKADPFRAIAERTQMTVWVRVGRRGQELAREPQETFRLVRLHEIVHHRLEVGENFDLGERFRVLCGHRSLGSSSGLTVVSLGLRFLARRRASRIPCVARIPGFPVCP